MFQTIQISPYISVQGMVTSLRTGGRVTISVDGKEYVGMPVGTEIGEAAPIQAEQRGLRSRD